MKKVTKKLFSLMLSLTFLLSFAPSVNVMAANADYFTDAEISRIINNGFPSNYRSSIYKVYESYKKYNGSNKDMFINYFIPSVKSITKSQGEQAGVIDQWTRAMYFEVSNLSDRINSLNGVADCMNNRIYSSQFPNDAYSVFKGALNGLNSSLSTEYWHSIMRNPLPDAIGGGTNAMDALSRAYYLACDIADGNYVRYSSLPTDYYYFNETPGTGRIKIGNFYFRKTY